MPSVQTDWTTVTITVIKKDETFSFRRDTYNTSIVSQCTDSLAKDILTSFENDYF